MLSDIRSPHRLECVLPNLRKVRREDAAEQVRHLGLRDEPEEPREGVRARALSAGDVGALYEGMEGEGGLEERGIEDVAGEKFGGPNDVGVAEMGEDVVGAEFGFVGGRKRRPGSACVVVEFVERFEDCLV